MRIPRENSKLENEEDEALGLKTNSLVVVTVPPSKKRYITGLMALLGVLVLFLTVRSPAKTLASPDVPSLSSAAFCVPKACLSPKHFISNSKLLVDQGKTYVALASFPGSGSTWTRAVSMFL